MSDVAMFWGIIGTMLALFSGFYALMRAEIRASLAPLEVRMTAVETRLSGVETQLTGIERLLNPIAQHFLEKGLAVDRQA